MYAHSPPPLSLCLCICVVVVRRLSSVRCTIGRKSRRTWLWWGCTRGIDLTARVHATWRRSLWTVSPTGSILVLHSHWWRVVGCGDVWRVEEPSFDSALVPCFGKKFLGSWAVASPVAGVVADRVVSRGNNTLLICLKSSHCFSALDSSFIVVPHMRRRRRRRR